MDSADKKQIEVVPPRRGFFRRLSMLSAAWPLSAYLRSGAAVAAPERLPIVPDSESPAWVREGVVATWGALPLIFFLRRDDAAADVLERQKEAYKESTVKRYKDMGFNLVIMSLHVGAGLKAEAEAIEGTRRFTEIAHRYGIRVSGYVGSTMWYETFYDEEPEAPKWEQVDERGRPMYYSDQTFRHEACRNNPGYQAFIQKVLRLGILDLKLDMIHFDQLQWWPEPLSCHCRYCLEGFHKFLRNRYTDEQLFIRLGHTNLDRVRVPDFDLDAPPVPQPTLHDSMKVDWTHFRCASLGQWWGETRAYIRKLNPQVALLGNPTFYVELNPGFVYGIDLQQLFPHCDFLWTEEGNDPRWTSDGRLVSRIRAFKMARAMGRSLFLWQRVANKQGIYEPPFDESLLTLGLAETLAYNDACLGSWNSKYGIEPTSRTNRYLDFFRSHIKDLAGTTEVTDIAILRSFNSIEFNPAKANVSTILFEQVLIQSKLPFGIIFDSHLKDLSRYRVLVLADQDALSDEQVGQIRRFVGAGGGLVATGNTSLLTDWRRGRNKFGLAEVLGIDNPPAEGNAVLRREFGRGRVVYIPHVESTLEPPPPKMTYDFGRQYWHLPKNHADLLEAVRWVSREKLSAQVDAPAWVTMELAEQKSTNTWLLHLLNFREEEPAKDLAVEIRVPEGLRLREVVVERAEGLERQALSPSGQEGVVSFRVPELQVYALALVRMESATGR